jgi:hypothetical protein
LDALLFSGEEERCGISSAPPIIALCEGSRGDWALASGSFGASEDLLHSKLWLSPLSMDRPAYAALGELAADEIPSGPPNEEDPWTCEGIWGGSAESERASSLAGTSKRGSSVGERESRPSTEFRGISWLLCGCWPSIFCGEIFLFFVEDVVKVSCTVQL